jgi:two-component system, cell cycle sensor histidine kinase and response regulator CckA
VRLTPTGSWRVHLVKKKKASSFSLLTAFLVLVLFIPSSLHGKTVLKVGVYNNKPTIFVDETGTAQGLFIDILEDIALREDWEIEYVAGHFSEVLHSLQTGTIDILPATAFSKEREGYVNFTNETVIANWGEIYTSTLLNITSLVELEGKVIAVKQDDIHFKALQNMVESFDISCRFIETDEYETIFEMLSSHYVDIGVVNRLYGNDNKAGYNVRDTPIIFNPIDLRYAFPKNKNEKIANTIDVYLTAAKIDQDGF